MTPTKDDSIKSAYYCNDSAITIEFLEDATYAEAITACNLTIIDREFRFKDIVPYGVRSDFSNIFTSEELQSATVFKEVKWESMDLDYIIVWYLKEDGYCKPFDLYEYDKSTTF